MLNVFVGTESDFFKSTDLGQLNLILKALWRHFQNSFTFINTHKNNEEIANFQNGNFYTILEKLFPLFKR